MKFNPKIGDKVRVCYDGKSGRAVIGKVTDSKNDHVRVQFQEWAGDYILQSWFSRHTDKSFGAFVSVPESLMRSAFGCPGDWYSVYPLEVAK